MAKLVASVALAAGCGGPSDPGPAGTLVRIASHDLALSEPSDLAIDPAGRTFWTVTNDPDRVYRLDPDGNVTYQPNFTGEDLEGIVYDVSDSTLWVVEENRRELVHLDLDGNVLGRTLLNLTGEPNSGPEGICFDPQGRIVLVNEKNPGLFIQLAADRTIASQMTLAFARDYSGICPGTQAGWYWVLSDQEQQVYLWDPSGGVHRVFGLATRKPEGVAFDAAQNLLYVVSDMDNKLDVYRYDPAAR